MSRSGRRRGAPAVSTEIDLSQDDNEDRMPLSSLASLARSVKREEYKDSIHTQPNSSPPRARSRIATQAQRDRQRVGRRRGEEEEENEEEGAEEGMEERQEMGEEKEEDEELELDYEEKEQPLSPASPPPLSPTQPAAASSSPPAPPPPYSSYFANVSYHQLATTLSTRQNYNSAQLRAALKETTSLLAGLHARLPAALAAQLRDDYVASVGREHAVVCGLGAALEDGRRLVGAGEVGWETRWEEEMKRAREAGEEKGKDELERLMEQADKVLADSRLRQQRERDRQQQRQRDREQGRRGGVEEADEEEGDGEGEEGGDMADGGQIILPLSQSQPQEPSASGRARVKRERQHR